MGALALLPTLVPAIGTVVKDVVEAVKGGATATTTAHDAKEATGDTAKEIAKDAHFTNAVKNKQPNNAANAAAALVPEKSVKEGASKSLSASGNVANTLSAELKAVVQALDPCYQAEDNVFAITQLVGKPNLDPHDKALLTSLWTAADENIKSIVAATKKQFDELGDPGAIAAFRAISKWKGSAGHAALDTCLKKPGNSIPQPLQTAANNLWGWLNTATIVGTTTITQITIGLDKIYESQPKAKPAVGGVNP